MDVRPVIPSLGNYQVEKSNESGQDQRRDDRRDQQDSSANITQENQRSSQATQKETNSVREQIQRQILDTNCLVNLLSKKIQSFPAGPVEFRHKTDSDAPNPYGKKVNWTL